MVDLQAAPPGLAGWETIIVMIVVWLVLYVVYKLLNRQRQE